MLQNSFEMWKSKVLLVCLISVIVASESSTAELDPVFKGFTCVDIGCKIAKILIRNETVLLRRVGVEEESSSCLKKYQDHSQTEVTLNVCNRTMKVDGYTARRLLQSVQNGDGTLQRRTRNATIRFICPVPGFATASDNTFSDRKRWQNKYVDVLVVVAGDLFKEFKRDKEETENWVKQIYDQVVDYFKDNLEIVMTYEVKIVEEAMDFLGYSDSDDALEGFAFFQYKIAKSMNKCFLVPNLLTTTAFKQFGRQDLGVAFVGTVCKNNGAAMITVNNKAHTRQVVKTIIHENLHLFYVDHDSEVCTCNDERGCIMNPQDKDKQDDTTSPINQLSKCSMSQFHEAETNDKLHCMVQPGFCKAAALKLTALLMTQLLSFATTWLLNRINF